MRAETAELGNRFFSPLEPAASEEDGKWLSFLWAVAVRAARNGVGNSEVLVVAGC